MNYTSSAQALLAVALLAVVYHVVVTVMVYENLRRRGLRVSFLWLRLYGPKYANQYRRITRQETGHTGPLFYHYVFSINTALVSGVAGLLMRGA